jgi:L-rhamnose mutarotase
MRSVFQSALASILLSGVVLALFGCAQPPQVRRYGMVIGLKPEKIAEYKDLHAHPWPEVIQQIKKSNIRNYSIYLAEINGQYYLFSYFEYTGKDFKADMAAMAQDPKTQEWWTHCKPCQIPLPGRPEGEWWMPVEEVFHSD